MPAGAPKNTLQLQGAVQTINVNNVLGLRYYYRSCETLLKQCNVFRSEGDKQNLFVGLMRFSSLLVETIPRHNQFNKKTDAHYKLLYKALLESLEELEGLKKDINAAAAAYEARSKLEASARAAQARANAQFADESVGLLSQQALKLPGVTAADLDDLYLGKLGLGGGKVAPEYLAPPLPAPVVPQYRPSPEFDFKASEGALQRHSLLPPPPPPPAGRQGETGKPARPPAPPPGPLYPDFDATPAHAPPPDAFQKRQLQAPAPAPAPEEARPSAPPQPQVAMPAPEQVAMPVQPQVAMPAPGAQVAMPASRQVAVPVPGPQYAPNLGPQLMEVNTLADTPETVGPLPPGHHTCSHASPGAVVPAGHQHSHGAPPRPAEVADPRPGRAEKQEGLMAVHISSHLLEEFMRLAGANTRNNLETCAVLAGQLKQGVYFINTLIVPKQEATSDSCSTLNEEELFEVQDKNDLFSLGWVHTHPTQTCFMSSIDIHTHCAYQTMLDEAIAIVMAPTDRNRRYGIFRLSTPEGLKMIQNCPERGFHPHPPLRDGRPLYDHCAHVYLNPQVKFEVMDLR